MSIQRKIHGFWIIVGYFAVTIYCSSVAVPYYNWEGNLLKKELFKTSGIFLKNDVSDFLINTPGCHIPDYTKNFKYHYAKEKHKTKNSCGERFIFVERNGNNKISFRIDTTGLLNHYNYANEKLKCCYKFAFKSISYSEIYENQNQIIFTKCKSFRSGNTVSLDYEIVVVSCALQKERKKEIYSDAFIILKKFEMNRKPKGRPWNVILMGMDSMSRARIFHTMPETVKFLQNNKWLDYRGYQKVNSNTFRNLISILTGKNATVIYAKCETGLYQCADYFIWNKFMESGYITAYAEDDLNLANTFSKFGGFKSKPTDHYIRPLYLLDESYSFNILCTKRSPSAIHLLNYAYDFADAYKNDLFFGMFWINSYSHSPSSNPSLLDEHMVEWLTKINNTGVLRNAFVLFFSDHGTRYGPMRTEIESYYDERLPMLFMWVPYEFQKLYPQKYTNMILNQHRLITSYDLYVTLGDILKLTNSSSPDIKSHACPQCPGIFQLNSLNRKCADASISDVWCSCHGMTEIANSASETLHSIHLAVTHIKNITAVIETVPCMKCHPTDLKRILRSHSFKIGYKIYNIVAFEMSHLVSFEAIVGYRGDRSKVTYLHTISSYNKKGNCVIDPNDRPYCDCRVTECKI